jgi:hypothetical protein
MSVTNRAQIEAYIGASGSGKGVSIKARLAELQPARLLIWDPRDEYGAHAMPYRTLGSLVAAWQKAGDKGPCRARYVHDATKTSVKVADAFAMVCKLAFSCGSLVLLAEELSDVTTPSHAPPAWRQITTQGRHKGLHVLGAAQRPALIDKTFLGNCTRIRCGALVYKADRAAMAAALDCHVDLIEPLGSVERPEGGARIEMLERDRHRRTLEAVTLTVSRGGRTTEKRQVKAPNPLRERRPRFT